MILPAWIDEAITEAKKLFTHSDPAVPAAAQSIVTKLETAKAEAIADAKQLGTEALGDGKTLLGEAEHDTAQILDDATGSATATPAK